MTIPVVTEIGTNLTLTHLVMARSTTLQRHRHIYKGVTLSPSSFALLPQQLNFCHCLMEASSLCLLLRTQQY